MNKLFTVIFVLVITCGFSQVKKDSIVDRSKEINAAFGNSAKQKSAWDFNVNIQVDIDSAERVYQSIPPTKRTVEVEEQKYNSHDVKIEMSKLEPNIKVFPLNENSEDVKDGSFVKLGVGNYTTPYLLLDYSTKEVSGFRAGVNYEHLSSSTGAVDKKNSAQSLNDIALKGEYTQPKFKVGLGIDNEYKCYNYYGYSEREIKPDRDTLRRNYNLIGGDFHFNWIDSTKMKLNSNFGYSYYYTNNKTKEGHFNATLKPVYQLSTNEKIRFDVDFSQISYDDTLFIAKDNRSFIEVKPSYEYIWNSLTASIGVNFTYENDTLATQKDIHFYPIVDLKYLLNKDYNLNVYLLYTGSMNKNTFQSYTREMPFANNAMQVEFSNNKQNVELGFTSFPVKNLGARINAQYAYFEGLNYFLNDSINQEKLNVIYDNTSRFKFEGELIYNKLDKFSAVLNAKYYIYKLDSLVSAFHKPTLETKLGLSFVLIEKLTVQPEVFFISGIKSFDYENQEEILLTPIIDLNIGVEYSFNSKMKAFVQVNNILNKNYEYIQYYKNKGINGLIGLSYTF